MTCTQTWFTAIISYTLLVTCYNLIIAHMAWVQVSEQPWDQNSINRSKHILKYEDITRFYCLFNFLDDLLMFNHAFGMFGMNLSFNRYGMFELTWFVYLTSLLNHVNRQGLMSDGPGARQWDEGWECPRREYTRFRTRDPVVWSRVFYCSTKPTVLYGMFVTLSSMTMHKAMSVIDRHGRKIRRLLEKNVNVSSKTKMTDL